MAGYRYTATARPSALLSNYPTFDTTQQAPALNVARARSGILVVTYARAIETAYPLVRIMVGKDAASLKPYPIEDASNATDLAGVGLQTDVRNGIKKLTDANDTGQTYPIILAAFSYVSFQFTEVNAVGTPGTLSAELLVELDH